MKATTSLQVKGDMRMTVSIEMTVEEADSILKAIAAVDTWPVGRLKEVFRQTLSVARAAYSSENVIEP